MGSPDSGLAQPRISYVGLAQTGSGLSGRAEYPGIETASTAMDDSPYGPNVGGLREPGPPPLTIYIPEPIL